MKKTFIGLIVFLLVLGMVFAAKPNSVEKTNPAGKIVSIPEHAVQVSPGVYYLGKAIDKGRVVEGYAIMVSEKAYRKPAKVCGNGICEPGENANKCPADCASGEDPVPDTSSCYGFLAKGAKWKTIEPYIVNPANTRGLDSTFVTDNLAADIGKWEEAAAGANILGTGSATSETLVADTVSTDGKNEVYFADIEEAGVIGFTIIWGIFGGPPNARELVEWDQVYDDVSFDWSATGESNKMDFESIATHELGHSVGMGDLYTGECSEETMYGYASNGETNKRSLEAGDITGINKLY